MKPKITFLIFILTIGMAQAQIDLNNGLVAYYPFNGDATDESGNGNDGTINGGVITTTDRFGNANKAMQFNGIDGYVDVPSLNSLPYTPITYSAWVTVNAYLPKEPSHHFKTILGRNTTFVLECGSIGLFANSGLENGKYDNTFTMWRGGGSSGNSPSTNIIPPLDLWCHVVYTQTSSGDWKWYFNGALSNSGNFTDSQNYYKFFRIGGDNNTSGNYYWDGNLDDIRIYSRALTEQEVQALYSENGWLGNIDLNNGLVAYYPFNGDANDASGNGNDGIPMNNYSYNNDFRGQSIKLTGSGHTGDQGGHVLLPVSILKNVTNFTISMWVNEEGMSSSDGESYISFGSPEEGFVSIAHYSNEMNFCVGAQSGALGIPYNDSYKNKWTHYVLAYANDKFDAYIDGTNIGSKTQTKMISFDGAAIGRHWFYNGTNTCTRLIGSIDQVRIYNRALTDQEIQSLYSENDFSGNSGKFYDSRDNNHPYNWVRIGTQVWMAENLAYLPAVSPSSAGSYTEPYYYVYDYEGTDVAAAKDNANYTTYGVLYNWEASKIACPPGWHLPSDEEWKQLEKSLGMTQEQADAIEMRGTDQGTQMKATSGWNSNGNGTNTSKFTALPAGFRSETGVFYHLGVTGNWSTSSEYAENTSVRWHRSIFYNGNGVYRNFPNKADAYSVRCVKDDPNTTVALSFDIIDNSIPKHNAGNIKLKIYESLTNWESLLFNQVSEAGIPLSWYTAPFGVHPYEIINQNPGEYWGTGEINVTETAIFDIPRSAPYEIGWHLPYKKIKTSYTSSDLYYGNSEETAAEIGMTTVHIPINVYNPGPYGRNIRATVFINQDKSNTNPLPYQTVYVEANETEPLVFDYKIPADLNPGSFLYIDVQIEAEYNNHFEISDRENGWESFMVKPYVAPAFAKELFFPQDGDINVPSFTSIYIAFNKDMDVVTVTNPENFKVNVNGTPIYGTIEYDEITNYAVFTPNYRFDGNISVEVVLQSFKDLNGNLITGIYNYSFQTNDINEWVLNVPYYWQGNTYYCWSTSLSMWYKYYGIDYEYWKMPLDNNEERLLGFEKGTPGKFLFNHLEILANVNVIPGRDKNSFKKFIKKSILKNYPVVYYCVAEYHTIIIVGIKVEDNIEYIIYHDPHEGSFIQKSWEEFFSDFNFTPIFGEVDIFNGDYNPLGDIAICINESVQFKEGIFTSQFYFDNESKYSANSILNLDIPKTLNEGFFNIMFKNKINSQNIIGLIPDGSRELGYYYFGNRNNLTAVLHGLENNSQKTDILSLKPFLTHSFFSGFSGSCKLKLTIFNANTNAMVDVNEKLIQINDKASLQPTAFLEVISNQFGNDNEFQIDLSQEKFTPGLYRLKFEVFQYSNTTPDDEYSVLFNLEGVDKTQQVALNTGWNIMSLYVMPNDPNLKNINQPLIIEGKLKKVMDESGAVIEDWGYFGGWQNTIGSLSNTEGYKINVTSPATLEVTGIPTQLPFEIPLNAGWNIISWPSPNEQNGMDVFQTLKDAGKLKKVMDESGKVIEDWGYFGGWQNNIGNFKPGEGYKVNVTAACTLTINESGTKSEEIIPEIIASTHFIPAYKGNGTDHMNINLVNLAESGIMEGDEIGIFDGNICVGSTQINIQHSTFNIQHSSISIPVSAVDGIEGKNGYTEGNSITLKLYRSGREYPLALQPLNPNKTVFEKGSSLFAQVGLVPELDELSGTKLPEIKCYPNPFSDEVTIEINLSTDAQVQVEVLNQLGQQVKTITTKKQLTSGVHRLTWNGRNTGNGEVAPGIYHLRVNIDDVIHHCKIVLSK